MSKSLCIVPLHERNPYDVSCMLNTLHERHTSWSQASPTLRSPKSANGKAKTTQRKTKSVDASVLGAFAKLSKEQQQVILKQLEQNNV